MNNEGDINMPEEKTLKQRIHDGEVINIASTSLATNKEGLEEFLRKDTYP